MVVIRLPAGNARDGKGNVRRRAAQGAPRHSNRDIGADCPALPQKLGRDAEQLGFGFLGVGDQSAVQVLTAPSTSKSTFESLPAVQDSAVTSEDLASAPPQSPVRRGLQASRSSLARLFQKPLRDRVDIPSAQ
jgi:hypothetical protein